MYLKVEKRKNKDGTSREYLYVAKTYREGSRVIQKHIMSLGRLDQYREGNTFENFAKKFAELAGNLEVLEAESDLNLDSAKELGMTFIYRQLWKKLGFDSVLNKYFQETGVQFDVQETIFAMVANRLAAPSSKREVARWKEEVFMPSWKNIEQHHLYRAMDYLVDKKQDFETDLYYKTVETFNQEVDIIMFDTTTASSWGEGKSCELLKFHGKPKDKRTDLRQLCIGVLMTKDGIPVGHEVWEGPRSEKKSFVDMINRIQGQFRIGKVVFVCDKGMISKKIIEYIEECQYEYILGVKMRQLPIGKRLQFLGKEGFKAAIRTDKKKLDVKEIVEDEVVKINGEEQIFSKRYIICYNPDKAKMDAEKRERFKAIIKEKVANSTTRSWIIKNGYKKYINFEGDNVSLVVDESKIDEEEIYDGKWILVTNTKLSSEDVVRNYKGLCKIESGFRDMKSEIEVGPIYHWTTKRVRAHVFICFLALVLKLGFERKMKDYNPDLDISEVIRSVNQMKVGQMKIKDKLINIRTNLQGLAYHAFKSIGSAVPEKILSDSAFSEPVKNVVGTPQNLRLF